MSQPTTIHLRPGATLALGAPELGAEVRRLASIAVHVATAAILALSVATAVASAPDRVTGESVRLTEPALVTDPAPPARSVVAEPEPAPAPTPAPGF